MDKKFWIIALGLVVFGVSVFLAWWMVSHNSSREVLSCNPELKAHAPSRTKMIRECMAVTGETESVNPIPNGSYQIRVRLDQEFSYLVNQVNADLHGGDLVAEVICSFEPPQKEAADKCRGYENKIIIPPAGKRVKIVGRYGLDLQQGWAVLSPVSEIEILN